ncbi:MAG: zf-HC2 domain-containing protein [Planctomycetes bacterium]|nr:zf-HC2 domain-containing protein [Planctomycetota bacterium]
MTTCTSIRGALGEYMDRQLDPLRREEVRAHVAGCEACAVELRALERLEQVLKSVPGDGESVRWEAYVSRVGAAARRARRGAWKVILPLGAAALFFAGWARWASTPAPPERPLSALLDEYASAGAARRAQIERDAGRGGAADLQALIAIMLDAHTPPPRQVAAVRILASSNDERVRGLALEQARAPAAEGADEWALLEIGAEPTDDELIEHAIELTKREDTAPEALRILRKIDRRGLNGPAHADIVRRVRGLLASEVEGDRRAGLRIVAALEVLEEDVIEFLDVPGLREAALDFLRRRAGQDFGADKEAWRAYFARRSGKM